MYSEEIVREKMEMAGIDPQRTIAPLDDIDDAKVFKFTGEISKHFSIGFLFLRAFVCSIQAFI